MKILITGGFGKVGQVLVKSLKDIHQLTVTDINIPETNHLENYDIQKLDITDLGECKAVINDSIDVVIHLAGTPNPDADFNETISLNTVGTYNVFTASIDAKVKKVIFASSAQTIEGYTKDKQLTETDITKPANFYGVSKVTCEALASYFSQSSSVKFIALRIGAFDELNKTDDKLNARDLSAYLSPKDLSQIVNKCINTTAINNFEVFNCISNNQYKRLDISKARQLLDYHPTSDAFLESGYKFKE